jgi:hypothetical protein
MDQYHGSLCGHVPALLQIEADHWSVTNVGLGSFSDVHERLLSAKSRPSSKEFICSVRSSLNDRFRLEAAGQIMELRRAENDP